VVGLVESRWVHYRIRSRFFALGELEIFVAVGEGGEGGEGDEQGEEVVLWRFAPSELADEVHRLPWLGAVPPHPGVLDVRNVFEADGSVYIAFERVRAIDVSRVAMPPLEAAWAPKPWLSRSFFAPDEADGEIGGVVRGVARQPLPHGIRTRDTPVDALPTSSGPRSLGARVRDAVASALRRREP